MTSQAPPSRTVDAWAEHYLGAGDLDRKVMEATLRCVARWGLAKTSFEDIAREAGVGRATVYRAMPGGKERLVEVVIAYELGRVAHELDARAREAASLEDLLCLGITEGLRLLTGHEALQFMLLHEPETVLPHFVFHRLDALFDHVTDLARPHLQRFLPPEDVRPAVELEVRLVLTYGFFRSPAVDPDRPGSIRRLVRHYVLPAVTTGSATTTSER